MTISRMTPVAELMQAQAFPIAAKAVERVRGELAHGFSTESMRKDCADHLNRAYRNVRDILCEVARDFLDQESQEANEAYWDNSFPFDLHHVRAKHYEYLAAFRDDLEPLFAVVRELVALRGELKAYVLQPKKTSKKDRAPMDGETFKTVGMCPCCGREYAVLAKTGDMSKHGYKVDKSWSIFTGVCSGESYPPIEVSRVHPDRVVEVMKAHAADTAALARKMISGKVKPNMVSVWDRKSGGRVEVEFDSLGEREKADALQVEIGNTQRKAREYALFAEHMEGLIKKYHGQPLRRVPV